MAAKKKNNTQKTVATVSLGCVKNIIDTEVFLAEIAEAGYVLTPYPDDADIVLVNTCAFIDEAIEESVAMLRDLVDFGTKKVIAVGCLPQRMGGELFELVPGLAGAVGLDEESRLAEIIKQAGKKKRLFSTKGPAKAAPLSDCPRLRITPSHYAYLRLSEGCNAGCTFCAIPRIRGRLRSKPHRLVLEEAGELAESGVRELILVSQDLTAYGADLSQENKAGAADGNLLCEVLRDLEKIDGIEWIRLLYLHPNKITDALIKAIAKSPKILSYLDLPFQHASPKVLKRMGRSGRTEPMALVEKLKQSIPDLVMRGTFLVGFPGEAEEDFAELEKFVADTGFQRGGVFGWSPQKGTRAFEFKDRVDEKTTQDRVERIRELLFNNAQSYAESAAGKNFSVFVDEPSETYLSARSYAESPDVDPVFRLPVGAANPGELIKVIAKSTDELDIIAEPLSQSR